MGVGKCRFFIFPTLVVRPFFVEKVNSFILTTDFRERKVSVCINLFVYCNDTENHICFFDVEHSGEDIS